MGGGGGVLLEHCLGIGGGGGVLLEHCLGIGGGIFSILSFGACMVARVLQPPSLQRIRFLQIIARLF
jgi:hypothetical protein